jgi:iron complex transport system substrate-binding protein
MSRATFANLLTFLAAIALSLAAVAGTPTPRAAAAPGDGDRAVVDGRGFPIPIGDYRRIVSVTVLSDPLLLELVEPHRFIAACAWSTGPGAFRLGDRPRIASPQEVEAILALRPDLVIAASGGTSEAHLARLRGAGIAVYDVGDLTGWATCARVIADLGRILGADARARSLLARCQRRLALAAAHPPASRQRALYAGIIQDRLFGGTVGTAYHDVLTGACLIDAAAEHHRGWPQYDIEDLLAMDPDLIVLAAGQAAALRRLPGADRLRARLIEMPTDLIEDPGLGIVDAVEWLRLAPGVHEGLR